MLVGCGGRQRGRAPRCRRMASDLGARRGRGPFHLGGLVGPPQGVNSTDIERATGALDRRGRSYFLGVDSLPTGLCCSCADSGRHPRWASRSDHRDLQHPVDGRHSLPLAATDLEENQNPMTVTIHPEILDGDLQGTRPGQRKTPGSKGPAENSGTPPARHRGADVRGEPEQQWGLGHRDNRDLTPGRASDPRKPMGRPLPRTGHQNARFRVAYHTHSGGTTLNITTRRVGSAVVAALAIFVIIAGKGALLTAGTAVAFPIRT